MKYKKNISCLISFGELLDKISILEIKKKKINNIEKKKIINTELQSLKSIKKKNKIFFKLFVKKKSLELKKINEKLWVIEDELRELERMKNFGNRFIKLARSVYFNNDLRSKIKNEINLFLGSSIREIKSYKKYAIS